MNKFLFLVLFITLYSGPGYAQQSVAYQDTWMKPIGSGATIYATVQSGNTIYIGGSFKYLGYSETYGAALSTTTGVPLGKYSNPNGKVYATIPDGNGGVYIGGTFSRVGAQTRNNLARLNSDGSLDSWNLNVNTYGIRAMAIKGNTLYIGGFFTNVGGQPRNGIAAIDMTTGLLTSWDPNIDGIAASLVISGNTIFVGGDFQHIGAQARNMIGAIDLNTGLATSFNPNANSTIAAMAMRGSKLYVGGHFNIIGGQIRNYLAALDTATGLANSWNPNPNNDTKAILVSTNTIYIGGDFTQVAGQARRGLAAIDTMGTATTWNPNNGNTTTVSISSIAASGTTIYVGGLFTKIGTTPRLNIAAIKTSNGALTSWKPNASDLVLSISIIGGDKIYTGGAFKNLGAVQRFRLAAFDAATGALKNWDPHVNSTVSSIAAKGNLVYAGGGFTNIGGVTRRRIGAIDTGTGLVTAFNPDADRSVRAISIKGNTIYAGGQFHNIGGQSRYAIAALDSATGLATSWNPGNYQSEYLNCIVVNGNTIYVGGLFTSIGGQNRHDIAALDATTGLATSWNPNPNNVVTSLALNGSNIYAGGAFATIGGQARNGIAAIDTLTGTATSWDPSANSTVNTIAIGENTVYVGGQFTTIGGQSRNSIAAIDAVTGLATSWNPNPVPGYSINGITVSGSTIYTGGSFLGMNNEPDRIYFMPLVDSNRLFYIAIASSDTTICQGASVTFTATAVNGGTSPTYQWIKNGTPIPGATNNTYTSNTLQPNDTIKCEGTSSISGNGPATSNEIVVIDNYCTPTVLSLNPVSSLCRGGNVDISFGANGFNVGNIFIAQLSDASGSFAAPVTIGSLSSNSSGVIHAMIPASQALGTGYRIRIISSSPSTTGPDNGSNISVVAIPTVAQTTITPAGTTSFCPGMSVSLSVPNTSGLSFQWARNGNSIAGATSNTYSSNIAGDYTLTATNASGCSRTSAITTVFAATDPIATISPAADQAICSGSTITFTANTDPGLSYQWVKTGTNIAGATGSSYTASTTGLFHVIVTNANGCRDTSSKVKITRTCPVEITNTGTVKKCSGDTITVNFIASSFSASNVFTLELSDASGSFASPVAIGTLPGSGSASGVMTGTIPSGLAGSGYKLRISSLSPPVTGLTSPLTIKISDTITENISLCAITVDSASGKNLLIWDKPATANIDSFVIYRKSNTTAAYEKIAAKAYNAFSTYLDITSEPAVLSARYYITAKNQCWETPQSTVHTTIHLVAVNKGGDDNTWSLIWNGYEGFSHSIYNIWRGTSTADMTILRTIEAREYNSFTDNTAPLGTVYYMISVMDGPSCNPTARTTGEGIRIASNIVTNGGMIVYPNPSSGSAHILITSSENEEPFQVRILDIAGRVVAQTNAISGRDLVFGTTLSPGIYTIEAVGKNGRMIRKWVKQ